jgi:two-component system, chemotaxis family, protein-glutamate methylesterase/glutaminase
MPAASAASASASRVVLIAASTGGPRALGELVPALPAPLGAGTVIVQHLPSGFTAPLARRLDKAARLRVREAADGDVLQPSLALLAPGGSHLRLTASGTASLSDAPEVGGLRPHADLTIVDAARAFGERTVLVVLTGMGNDGLVGAEQVRRRGGRVLVEAESSCIVYGMPRAVAEARLAHVALPLGELPAAIAAEAAS